MRGKSIVKTSGGGRCSQSETQGKRGVTRIERGCLGGMRQELAGVATRSLGFAQYGQRNASRR